MQTALRGNFADTQKCVLLSMGNRVPKGSYALHSRFKHVVNFTDGQSCIALTDCLDNQSPVNIVVSGVDLGTIKSVIVKSAHIHADDYIISRTNTQLYDSSLSFSTVDHALFIRNIAYARRIMVEHASPMSLCFLLDRSRESFFKSGFERVFVAQMRQGAELFFAGDVVRGTDALKGRGFGLTPSGDDFICGALFATHLFEKVTNHDLSEMRKQVFVHGLGGSLFSNTFLRLAYSGDYYLSIRDAAHSLLSDDKSLVEDSFKKLMQTGETSGADLGTGFLMTLDKLMEDFQIRSRMYAD